jgi:hypothetical protein
MPHVGVVRLHRHRLAQEDVALLIHAACAVEIGEIDERGNEFWVEAQSRLILLLGLGPAPQLRASLYRPRRRSGSAPPR